MRLGAGIGWPSGGHVPLLGGDQHGLSDAPGQGLGSGSPILMALFSPGRAGPGEGASRRLSADPGGCSVIIPAAPAAGAGLSHRLAQDLEARRGWEPRARTLLPSASSPGLQGARVAPSPPHA